MATVGEVGERALIEIMLRWFTPMPDMPVPFWDDVMAIGIGDGRVVVINTDMLVWETDVPQGMTPFQAGRKAVVMNFSDLGAKGVRPQAFLASIGIPRKTPVRVVEEIARGFEVGTREHGGYVIGGDTNEAADIVISGIALGVAHDDRLMKRQGAKPGDILATTGLFGETTAAFKILLGGYEAPEALKAALVESVYNPKTRVEEGVALAKTGSVSASIDSSDGLAISLHDLTRSSMVGFRLDSIPTSPNAIKFAGLHGIRSEDLALYGGEEYELVFTVRPSELEKVREALHAVGGELIVLGETTAEKDIVFMEDGEREPIGKEGWEHFTMGA